MPFTEVEPDEIRARLARGEDVFLLDVREPSELRNGPIPSGSTSHWVSYRIASTNCHKAPPSWWPAKSAVDPPRRPTS